MPPSTVRFLPLPARLEIRWSVEEGGDEPRLVFRWQERGGPRLASPQRTGFGTTLLNSAISGGDGTPRIEYAPEGVRYTLEVALSEVAGESGVEKTRWKQGQPSIDASRPMAR